MIPRRRTFLIGCLVLSAAGLAWIRTDTAWQRIPAEQLEAEQAYAVDVTFDRSQIDLPFDRETRYLLIVGSLSGEPGPHRVMLSADPIGETAGVAARKIVPLGARSDEPGTMLAERVPPEGESESVNDAPLGQQKDASSSPATRDFYLHVTDGTLEDPRHYVRVRGRLVGEGRDVRVFLDEQQQPSELNPRLIDETVRLLDVDLIPSFRRQVGDYRDVDGDGKFTVLISPWLGRLQGGKTSLGGFVRGSDFRGNVERPFSNRGDMLYLNSNLAPGPHLKTLLAHEFMHVVCFSERLPSTERLFGLPDEEDWLNEAIAHLSENLHGGGWSNIDYRISRFLNRPERYPLVVEDYYDSGLWRDHGCRGATYLFLRWCVDRFGVELLSRLIRAPGRGRANLEQATGLQFDELFRRWTLALYQSGRRAAPVIADSAAEKTAAQADDYQSLDLRGPISNWGLAGPRTIDWNVDAGPRSIELAGTSAAFIELRSPGGSGLCRINVRADFGTKLQVTLLKQPSDWPQIGVKAKWIGGASAQSGDGARPDGNYVLSLQVTGSESAAPHVEFIACERFRPDGRESFCFSGKLLEVCRRQSGATQTGKASSIGEFHLPPVNSSKAGWLVKVVARDAQGRRASAWVDVAKPVVTSDRLRMARASAAGSHVD